MATPLDTVPMFKGTLELLILKALSWGPMHGYGISVLLERQGGGAFEIDDSALYQALQRLEGKGLLRAGWRVTENNRKARFYRLTPTGRQRLRQETATWQRYASSVSSILALAHLPT